MATLREKVLRNKKPVKIIMGTASTEKPIGTEGKMLYPAQHPPAAKYAGPTAAEREAKYLAGRKKINDYWLERNRLANEKNRPK